MIFFLSYEEAILKSTKYYLHNVLDCVIQNLAFIVYSNLFFTMFYELLMCKLLLFYRNNTIAWRWLRLAVQPFGGADIRALADPLRSGIESLVEPYKSTCRALSVRVRPVAGARAQLLRAAQSRTHRSPFHKGELREGLGLQLQVPGHHLVSLLARDLSEGALQVIRDAWIADRTNVELYCDPCHGNCSGIKLHGRFSCCKNFFTKKIKAEFVFERNAGTECNTWFPSDYYLFSFWAEMSAFFI